MSTPADGAAAAKTALELETARLTNVAALQTIVKAATPNLADVKSGEFKGDDKVIFGAELRAKALTEAAQAVADAVASEQPAGTVLVTADADLLERDALRFSLTTRMTVLSQQLEAAAAPRPSAPSDIAAEGFGFGLATAAAQFLPGLLSMLAVNRTLTSETITIADVEAVAAVAGALVKGRPEVDGQTMRSARNVVIDGIRFFPGGEGSAVLTAYDNLRLALARLDAEIALEKDKEDSQDVAWLATASVLVTLAREVVISVGAIPAGATMSPLSSAVAVESINATSYPLLLVVRPSSSSTVQLVSDRPLWWSDTVHSVATVSLTYVLLKVEDSAVVASGVTFGASQRKGTLTGEIR